MYLFAIFIRHGRVVGRAGVGAEYDTVGIDQSDDRRARLGGQGQDRPVVVVGGGGRRCGEEELVLLDECIPMDIVECKPARSDITIIDHEGRSSGGGGCELRHDAFDGYEEGGAAGNERRRNERQFELTSERTPSLPLFLFDNNAPSRETNDK